MKLTWHLQISENNPPGKGDSYWKPKQIPTNPSISFAKIGRSNWFFSNQVHPFTNSGQDDNISHFLRPSQHGGPTKSRFYDGVVSDGVIRNTCRVMVMATKIGVLFKPLSHWVLPLPWPMCWHKFRGNKKTQHRDSNSATSTKTTRACTCFSRWAFVAPTIFCWGK